MADKNYLCFEAVEDTDISFAITGTLTNVPSIQYSTNDGNTWNDYTFGDTISLLIGDKCYWKATTINDSFNTSRNNRISFASTSKVKASGNIMSLLDSSCESITIPNNYCFCDLFYQCAWLLTAPLLPATNLKQYCYQQMFTGCTSLEKAPQLPATVLKEACYSSMFMGCSGLKEVPNFPKYSSLPINCFYSMFTNCTSLVRSNLINSNTLESNCCYNMYSGCTSLRDVSNIFAMVRLNALCCGNLFYGCSSLKISTTRTDECWQEFRIYTSGRATIASNWSNNMFALTSGTFTSNPSVDTAYYANAPIYDITLEYDESLGVASYTRTSTTYKNNVSLVVNSTTTRFLGWYIDGELISSGSSISYNLVKDSVIEARFEQPFDVNTSVEGNGSIQVIRDEKAQNDITLIATASTGNEFVKYEIDGVEITENPYQLTLTQDIDVVAYFKELTSYNINITSNINGITQYQSSKIAYEGDSVEIRAREISEYKFVGWSDGIMDNPRTITFNGNVNLTAMYEKLVFNETYYQYRGFVKDQLNMTEKPKAFILARSDKDKEDLLTKANSTIEVDQVPSNIIEGDVLVLYTPKGTRYYQGVISKISENKITCTQMQSYFKGIFNKSYINHMTQSTYVENEIKAVIEQFVSGVYYGTTYEDTLLQTRLNGFTIQSIGTQQVHLQTDKDSDGNDKNTQYDMEQFLYDIYDSYGVIPEFTVNFEGQNYLKIFTPSYSQITIGNNQNAITELSPITTIEGTNKLIIFNQDGTYRTTFVVRKDGEIVEEPLSTANRFELTNTKIVKSSDTNEVLIANNLPSKQYNHKLTFTLLVENNLYNWQDLKLGMPLHIFIDGSFFDSVLTSREIIHNENQNIKQVKYTCGKIRLDITAILNNRFGRSS